MGYVSAPWHAPLFPVSEGSRRLSVTCPPSAEGCSRCGLSCLVASAVNDCSFELGIRDSSAVLAVVRCTCLGSPQYSCSFSCRYVWVEAIAPLCMSDSVAVQSCVCVNIQKRVRAVLSQCPKCSHLLVTRSILLVSPG